MVSDLRKECIYACCVVQHTYVGLEQVRNPSGESAEVTVGDRQIRAEVHGYAKQTGKKKQEKKTGTFCQVQTITPLCRNGF